MTNNCMQSNDAPYCYNPERMRVCITGCSQIREEHMKQDKCFQKVPWICAFKCDFLARVLIKIDFKATGKFI